jgi:hypothetical protein
MTTTSAKLQAALNEATFGLRELFTFVKFCESAISLSPLIVKIPQLIDHLTMQGMPKMPAALTGKIREEAKAIELGEGQDDKHAAYLHGLAIVKACTLLETAVDDVALTLLSDRDYWASLDGLGKLRANKVDLIGLLTMSHAQQTAYLLSEIRKEVGVSNQVGAGKYEAILNFVGLGGRIPDLAARALLELLETRHLLVHRRGFVDGKFVQRCPWRKAELGTALPLERIDFGVTLLSAMWYLLEMQQRASRLFTDCQFEQDETFVDGVLQDLIEASRKREELWQSPDADNPISTHQNS